MATPDGLCDNGRMEKLISSITNDFSLIYAAGRNGHLYQIHFGMSLTSPSEALSRLERSASFSGEYGWPIFDLSEYPVELFLDGTPLRLHFHYNGHETVAGQDRETLTITLKDTEKEVYLTIVQTAYPDFGIITVHSVISHQLDIPVTMGSLPSFYFSERRWAYFLTGYLEPPSRQSFRNTAVLDQYHHGPHLFREIEDSAAYGSWNGFSIDFDYRTTEYTGRTLFVLSPGNDSFYAEGCVDAYGILHVHAGDRFHNKPVPLPAGAELKSSELVLNYSTLGDSLATAKYHRWKRFMNNPLQFSELIPDNRHLEEIFIRLWSRTYFFPPEASTLEIGPKLLFTFKQSGKPIKFLFDLALAFRLHYRPASAHAPENRHNPRTDRSEKAFIDGVLKIKPDIEAITARSRLFRLLSPDSRPYSSLMYISDDGWRVLVFVWVTEHRAEARYPFLRLSHLVPEARYRIKEINLPNDRGAITPMHGTTVTGNFLIHSGLDIPFSRSYESAVILMEMMEGR